MKRGEFEAATRRALTLLDEWNEVTGCIPEGSSYKGEIESIVRDAVDIGARAALGMKYMMVGKDGYNNDPFPDSVVAAARREGR